MVDTVHIHTLGGINYSLSLSEQLYHIREAYPKTKLHEKIAPSDKLGRPSKLGRKSYKPNRVRKG